MPPSTVLIAVLPRTGMRWGNWGNKKEFLSNQQSRQIFRVFRSHLPNMKSDTIGWGLVEMVRLFEANLNLCKHFMLPRHFFEHIKNEVSWMSQLDGAILAALFRAILLARTRITTIVDYMWETDQKVPRHMLDESRLTQAVDTMMKAFKAKYQCGYWQLHVDYGFKAACNSDTEPEDEKDSKDGGPQGATNKDGSTTTEPDNNQDGDGDTAMVESNELNAPMIEAPAHAFGDLTLAEQDGQTN